MKTFLRCLFASAIVFALSFTSKTEEIAPRIESSEKFDELTKTSKTLQDLIEQGYKIEKISKLRVTYPDPNIAYANLITMINAQNFRVLYIWINVFTANTVDYEVVFFTRWTQIYNGQTYNMYPRFTLPAYQRHGDGAFVLGRVNSSYGYIVDEGDWEVASYCPGVCWL